MTIVHSLELPAYGKQLPTCRMTLGFSYFPRPRPARLVNNRSRDRHSANQNSLFLAASLLKEFRNMSVDQRARGKLDR